MRRALVSLVALAALVLVGAAAALVTLYATADTSTVGELDFTNELQVPPLLEGQPDGDGRNVFDLRLQTGRSKLLPGETTETWGINGPHLGPTLRLERGDRVRMEVRNDLPEPTTVHWHGMHLPAAPTAARTSRSTPAPRGRRSGPSTSRRPRSGTTRTRIRTATTRSTAGWRG